MQLERIVKRLLSVSAILVVIVFSVAPVQGEFTFLVPISGGSVAHDFDDMYVPGWYNTGIDYWGPNKQATYVVASNVGVVEKVVLNGDNDHGMGNCVVIKHNVLSSTTGATTPYFTLYANMDSIANLKVGQTVNQGQIIGVMRATGYGYRDYWGSTPYLHFEVKMTDTTSNPSGGGPYWLDTPQPAETCGYIDPHWVIGIWRAR